MDVNKCATSSHTVTIYYQVMPVLIDLYLAVTFFISISTIQLGPSSFARNIARYTILNTCVNFYRVPD